MKTSTQTRITLKALDLELKALLEEDLKRFKNTNSKNNQAGNQLMAA